MFDLDKRERAPILGMLENCWIRAVVINNASRSRIPDRNVIPSGRAFRCHRSSGTLSVPCNADDRALSVNADDRILDIFRHRRGTYWRYQYIRKRWLKFSQKTRGRFCADLPAANVAIKRLRRKLLLPQIDNAALALIKFPAYCGRYSVAHWRCASDGTLTLL